MPQIFKIVPAKFMQDDALQELFTIINNRGGKIKFVGGCIRDLILQRPIKDLDLATDLEPGEIISILDHAQIPCLKAQAFEYGTVTALLDLYSTNPMIKKVEITSLRKDVETFGRQAQIEHTKSFEEDAQRRDFTINALYADSDGKVYDFVNGYRDLKAKKLLFIGSPDERILEDYLRILRYFRFYATLEEISFDDNALDACARHAEGLLQLSGERIFKELLLILNANNPASVFELMAGEKILDKILEHTPDFELLRNLVWLESKAKINLPKVTVNPIRRLAAIITPTIADAQKTIEKLKLSKIQAQRLLTITTPPFEIFYELEAFQVKKILHNYGAEVFQDLVLLKWAKERTKEGKTDSETIEKWYDLLAMAADWRPMEFGLKGQDVIARGVPEGKMVGEILSVLEEWWQENDFKQGREELLIELDKIIAKYNCS